MKRLISLVMTITMLVLLSLAIIPSSANASTMPVNSVQNSSTLLVPSSAQVEINVNNRKYDGSIPIAASGSEPVNWSASENSTWLSFNRSSGTTPSTCDFHINALGLAVGTYSTTITITSSGATNSPVTIQLTFTLIEKSELFVGEGLKPGGYIRSPNKQYKLTLQIDGNLVLYNSNNQPIWASNTNGNAVKEFRVTLSSLQILNTADQLIWMSPMQEHSYYIQTSKIIITNYGAVVGYDPYYNQTWATHKLLNILTLLPGQELGASGGNQYRLKMQEDGNLVLRNGNAEILWATNTYGNPGSYCIMERCNLVIYNSANQPIWTTGIEEDRYRSAQYNLHVRPDGNVVISNTSDDRIVYWDRY